MDVSLAQALAWRLERHFLVTGAGSVTQVVRRLGAVPVWSGDPGLATGRRLARPSSDALADAVGDGDLIRTYAFRGATHVLAADDAGVYLAVRCANRQWELPSWQAHYDLSPQDWPTLREMVRRCRARTCSPLRTGREGRESPPVPASAGRTLPSRPHAAQAAGMARGPVLRPSPGRTTHLPIAGIQSPMDRPSRSPRGRKASDPRLSGRIRAGDAGEPALLAGRGSQCRSPTAGRLDR
jgi:hypothetical protein